MQLFLWTKNWRESNRMRVLKKIIYTADPKRKLLWPIDKELAGKSSSVLNTNVQKFIPVSLMCYVHISWIPTHNFSYEFLTVEELKLILNHFLYITASHEVFFWREERGEHAVNRLHKWTKNGRETHFCTYICS